MKNEPVVVERIYDAPIVKVWNALTDKEEMRQWYFDLAEFKPEVGFEFSFEAGDKGALHLHLCKVTEVVPGSKLTYSWRYDGHPGNSHVTFELFPEGDKTKLILTHRGLETFPAIAAFAKENFIGGWNHFVNIKLKDYLEKTNK